MNWPVNGIRDLGDEQHAVHGEPAQFVVEKAFAER
jgi:hypothetical protein